MWIASASRRSGGKIRFSIPAREIAGAAAPRACGSALGGVRTSRDRSALLALCSALERKNPVCVDSLFSGNGCRPGYRRSRGTFWQRPDACILADRVDHAMLVNPSLLTSARARRWRFRRSDRWRSRWVFAEAGVTVWMDGESRLWACRRPRAARDGGGACWAKRFVDDAHFRRGSVELPWPVIASLVGVGPLGSKFWL